MFLIEAQVSEMFLIEAQPGENEMVDDTLGPLDLSPNDSILDEVDVHIQANLGDSLVQEALKTGVDLRQYSKQVEAELQQIEHASIRDYIKESQNIASLHHQIGACDTILQRMEEMLTTFQSDLQSISAEIQSLQEESLAMNVKLRNRQAVRGELSQLVDELAVPEHMVTVILDVPVTAQTFMEQLQELNNKINFAKEQAFRDTLACRDVQDVLLKLKLKAISKIREFVLQKIYSFRKPMTNYQVAQNTLLKFRFFFEFLLTNERQVAKEVRDEYVETMSKIYCSYFKSYTSRLMKLQFEDVANKDDLMGVEDTAKKGFFSMPSLKNRDTIFTVGNRGAVISADLEGPIIVPHAAQKNDIKHSFESLFRSQHYALLDNCCREFLFLCDFFMVSGNPAFDLFNSVLGRSLNMFLKHMEAYVAACYDSIAIFLCIHIILRFQTIMTRRSVPALDRYWDHLLQLLWPRFAYILQLNIESIHTTEPQKLGSIDTHPHYITRRYAEFSSAIVSINQTFPKDRVHNLLGQLQAPKAETAPREETWRSCQQVVGVFSPERTRDEQQQVSNEFGCFSVKGTDQSQLPGGGEDSQRKETVHYCGATHPAMRQGDVQRSAWRDGGFQDKHQAAFCRHDSPTDNRHGRRHRPPAVEVENFILLMAAEFSSRKEQLVFLINNYDMMLIVLMERAAEDSKEVEGFQQLLNARTQEFVEELLAPPFGGMVAFVKDTESHLEKGQLDKLRQSESQVVALVRGFAATWKQAIEAISEDVMRSFTNFKNGTGIIQAALTQLIQYYHRFQKVLAQPPFKALPIRGELINIHHLMVEVKKHRPNF
uniref:vacuolar protein sorting-associated protein 52 homolog isoform X2 n=1 Tax=Myxine glutinosa TaxID=7769 RepID=UPI00359019D4